MSESDRPIERLISRYLDGECSPAEKREFQRLLRRDPLAQALFEEDSALDREVGCALRRAIHGPFAQRRSDGAFWSRAVRFVPLAVAAGLMAALWRPPAPAPAPAHNAGMAPAGGSWFAPPPENGDVFGAVSSFERPRIQVKDADRNWVLMPGGRPDEFLIVEIKQEKSRTIPLQGDF